MTKESRMGGYLFDEVADRGSETSHHLHDGVIAGRVELELELLHGYLVKGTLQDDKRRVA